VFAVSNEPLKIKRKYDDGNRVISVRIGEELLAKLDDLASSSNRSRNEIINLLLEHGVRNTEIE
jgi:metal-responsive CopG/Arc/MetJ family transcriptional regulator